MDCLANFEVRFSKNAVFDDYRTMRPRYTVIPFSQINYNGSDYWPVTRALVTNLVNIARIQEDKQLMRQAITHIVGNGWNYSRQLRLHPQIRPRPSVVSGLCPASLYPSDRVAICRCVQEFFVGNVCPAKAIQS